MTEMAEKFLQLLIGAVLSVLLSFGLGITAQAQAQAYPTKPVRIIVPSSPGGFNDGLARSLAIRLTERWGQQVLIDNKPGGNGLIGAEATAKAPADGYTLMLTPDSVLVMNPSLYAKLPYDPVKDFEPITVICSPTQVMIVNASIPVASVQELISLAKVKPGTLSYASTGNGSTTHLNTELIKSIAGIDIVHVPYKGGAPALRDVVGGQVSMMIIAVTLAQPFVRAGKLKALAMGTRTRSVLMPEVPTFFEAGLAGYEAAPWFGLIAPAGTPREIVDKINTEVVKALHDPVFREQVLVRQGLEPIGNSPAEFSALIKTELVKWAKVVKATRARLD